jgi:hypothetical protein
LNFLSTPDKACVIEFYRQLTGHTKRQLLYEIEKLIAVLQIRSLAFLPLSK